MFFGCLVHSHGLRSDQSCACGACRLCLCLSPVPVAPVAPVATVAKPAAKPKGSAANMTTKETREKYWKKVDEQLISVLQTGKIRLLDTKWFISHPESAQATLQMLEESTPEALLAPAAAAALARRGDRSIGTLSYGWGMAGRPDPTGGIYNKVVAFLLAHPEIEALFWDHASMYQFPRDEAQDEIFRIGLKLMGDLYASPTATTMLQVRVMAPRPTELNGVLHLVETQDYDEAQLREIFRKFGTVMRISEGHEGKLVASGDRLARTVVLDSHEAAERCAAHFLQKWIDAGQPSSGMLGARLAYNDVPTLERGWPTFEFYLCLLVTALLHMYKPHSDVIDEATAQLDARPKLYVIDDTSQAVLPSEKLEGLQDYNRVRAQIMDAKFTNKNDVGQVLELYDSYLDKLRKLFTNCVPFRVAEEIILPIPGVAGAERGFRRYIDGSSYEGEFLNGARHGQGKYVMWTGDVYEGSFVNGERTGKGVYTSNMTKYRYEGEFVDGKKHGMGVLTEVDGSTTTGRWENDHAIGRAPGDGAQGVGAGGKDNVADGCVGECTGQAGAVAHRCGA